MITKLVSAALGVVVTLGMAGMVSVSTVSAEDIAVPGNNGTLKIHEEGTPAKTESNSPKVCSFNLESFGLDEGQEGTITFEVQGGDGPTGVAAGPFAFGPADADGYFATQYFDLQNGHYKATLFGKDVGSEGDSDPEEKAKSKVFKVDCEPVVVPGVPGSAVSLVCPTNKYTLTVSNTGTTDLVVQVNGVDRTIAKGAAAITADFNVGDVLTVKVDGTPVTVEGKVLNNFKLVTCQGMGSTIITKDTTRVSSGFGAGAATNVASLPVTSGSSAQIATVVVMISSLLAAAGAYAARARSGMAL